MDASVPQEFLGNIGLGNPWVRGAAGAVLMAAYLFLVKPSCSFGPSGNMKSLVFFSKDQKNSTVLHPALLIALSAFVFACFL